MIQNLPTKLSIKFADKVLIINDKIDLLQKLYYYNFIIYDKYSQVGIPNVVIIFVEDMSKLDIYMSEYHNNIYKHKHLLRICYPKLIGKLSTNINRDKIRKNMIEKYNMTGVKLVSLDDDYFAMSYTKI